MQTDRCALIVLLRARKLALAEARSSLVLGIGALSNAVAVRSVTPMVSGVKAGGSLTNSFFISILIFLEFPESCVGKKRCCRHDNPGDHSFF
jgi:hypothetical protein